MSWVTQLGHALERAVTIPRRNQVRLKALGAQVGAEIEDVFHAAGEEAAKEATQAIVDALLAALKGKTGKSNGNDANAGG